MNFNQANDYFDNVNKNLSRPESHQETNRDPTQQNQLENETADMTEDLL